MLTGFNRANATDTAYKPSEAKITYVGSQSNLLTFNIDYANVEETPFTLELTDDDGKLLFQKQYTAKSFNKNLLLKNMGEMVKINFTIKSGKKVINQMFSIDTHSKLVENVVVTKL